MHPIPLKVARIGNSRGVRLPAATLARYQIGAEVIMEERSDGILLRPAPSVSPKLSWEETARGIALAAEDWEDWNSVATDGLEELSWNTPPARRVAEDSPIDGRGPRKRRS
jgi:antitoxin component of MazEF toxin-antitoxin module